jgi:hypothetical protein
LFINGRCLSTASVPALFFSAIGFAAFTPSLSHREKPVSNQAHRRFALTRLAATLSRPTGEGDDYLRDLGINVRYLHSKGVGPISDEFTA